MPKSIEPKLSLTLGPSFFSEVNVDIKISMSPERKPEGHGIATPPGTQDLQDFARRYEHG
jgi:hypothetical protein